MDQEPSLYSEPLSAPEILSPGNNDSIDGKVVSISGTADREVSIRIWDWLSPVAATTADGDGLWSITLHEVEMGDHMYCAEAYRDSPTRSARSQVVAVRIMPATRSSVASSSHTPDRWKVSPTVFMRRLVGPRRSVSRADATRQVKSEAERESPADIQEFTPISPSADDTYSRVPPTEDVPSHDLPAAVAPVPLDSATERESVPAKPPIGVSAYPVADESPVIEALTQALLMPLELVDMGTADEVLDLVASIDATTRLVPVPAAPERIWTERVPVEYSPTVHALDTGG